jgi:glycerol-3-phosphate dehydrogenase
MRRNVSALAEREYDLIIIGGGIFGICAAWDATLRGLSVALVERGDFGHATSANHFKIVHGGIRYLQHADLYRIRESNLERNVLLRTAPHLVHPLPFVIPTYGHGMQGKEALTAGLWLYNLITFDRNRGLRDPQRRIPRARFISRQECLEMSPHLEHRGLTGAAVFHEGQMYNPTRLSLSYLRSAVESGADAANHLEVTGFVRDRDRVFGVEAQDRLSGDGLEIRGRVVLNAAGPWAGHLLGIHMGLRLRPAPFFSRDAYFVVGRRLVGDYALAAQGKTKDPDALLSRGHRHLFLVPWRDYTLIGVWHVVHNGAPDEFTVTEEDLQGFLDEINEANPSLGLTLKDVSMWNAGLTLFGENEPGATDLSYGKRSLIIDHAKDHGLEGLVTLIGVRFTTARGVATKAINLVFEKLGRKLPKSATAVTPIYGGQIECFDEFLHQATEQRPPGLCAEVMPAMLHNHGSAYPEVLKYIDENPTWVETVGTSKVIKAEVVHAVRKEMAQKLGDVVFRRTDLGTGEHPGEAALRTCAGLMAAELEWDEGRVQKELAEVRAVFPNF